MAEIVIRGMVRVEESTYRIVRQRSRSYAVVRIADDLEVGAFQTGPLRVQTTHVEPELLRAIAMLAMRLAKTSAVTHRRPSPPPRAPAPRFPSSQPPPSSGAV